MENSNRRAFPPAPSFALLLLEAALVEDAELAVAELVADDAPPEPVLSLDEQAAEARSDSAAKMGKEHLVEIVIRQVLQERWRGGGSSRPSLDHLGSSRIADLGARAGM